ncbi:hypothetical protein DL98DRAFT_144253 [Cadophora sp. DSE1049]|nr:hypothetical protein DL98DRAFT_144253 [Cadophora sp. DSE1049]
MVESVEARCDFTEAGFRRTLLFSSVALLHGVSCFADIKPTELLLAPNPSRSIWCCYIPCGPVRGRSLCLGVIAWDYESGKEIFKALRLIGDVFWEESITADSASQIERIEYFVDRRCSWACGGVRVKDSPKAPR